MERLQMADREADACTFQWKIENISHCWWLKKAIDISSPTFIADALEGTKWSLSLYPMGHTEEGNVGFYLNREKDCDKFNSIEVNYKLVFLGKDGSSLHETNASNSFMRGITQGFETLPRERVFVTEREKFLPEDTLTVQCILWRHKTKRVCVESKYIYARTIYKMNRLYIEWKIENVSTLGYAVKKQYEDDSISFELVFNGRINKELKLNGISFNDSLNYVSCRCSVLDSDGKKVDCGIKEYLLKGERPMYLNLRFPDTLVQKVMRCITDDALFLEFVFTTVQCTSCQRNYLEFEYQPCYVETQESRHTIALTNDLKSMYNDKILTDVVLRTDTKEFPAHKAILSARSQVFNRMFSTDMTENNSGEVYIADFKDDTVHCMLLYLYTDSLIELKLERAGELYEIADKYAIHSLKSSCSHFLIANLCQTNACNILVLADQHNDDNLKSAVQDFLICQSKQYFVSQRWDDFMTYHLELASQVMRKRIVNL